MQIEIASSVTYYISDYFLVELHKNISDQIKMDTKASPGGQYSPGKAFSRRATFRKSKELRPAPQASKLEDQVDRQVLKNCIDSITIFDEQKREQMQYKQIIRDCFSQLFKKNCKLVSSFSLEGQLNDIAMRMRQLNLDDPEIYVDNAWNSLSPRRFPDEADDLDCGGDLDANGNETKLDSINRSNLDVADKSPCTLKQDSIQSNSVTQPNTNRQKSTLRSKLSLTAKQESVKLPKTKKMCIRLDRSQLYVVLKGKVKVERADKCADLLENRIYINENNDAEEDVLGLAPLGESKSKEETVQQQKTADLQSPDIKKLGLPKLQLNKSIDSQNAQSPEAKAPLPLSPRVTNLSLSNQSSPRKSIDGLDKTANLDTMRSIEKNKVENKNSFMRPESLMIRRIKHMESLIYRSKAGKQPGGPPPLKLSLESDSEKLKNLLIETSFLYEFTTASNPALQANMVKDELQWKFNSTINDMQSVFRRNYIIKEYERIVSEEQQQIEKMVSLAEAADTNMDDANDVVEGQFVNQCTMISPSLYLENYQLTYDGTVPEKDLPIIATITQQEFKESLLHTDDQAVEAIIQFTSSIPGFGQIDRSVAKRLFYLFTKLKVQKGWQMQSYEHKNKAAGQGQGHPGHQQQATHGLDEGLPDDDNMSKLYIIQNGQFAFKSLNRKMQPSVLKPAARVNNTTLTKLQGNKGKGKSGSAMDGSNKQIMLKFLNLKEMNEPPQVTVEGFSDNQPITSARAKVSIEDKKHIQKQEQKLVNAAGLDMEDRVRRLLLCKGQIFGEDECLRHIIDFSNAQIEAPIDMHYTVTCESNDAELLVANVDDVYKLIKVETKVVKFMKEQYVQKFPSQKPADDFFKGVFSGKMTDNNKIAEEITQNSTQGDDDGNITKQVRTIVDQAKKSYSLEQNKSSMRTQTAPSVQQLDSERKSYAPPAMPLMRNLMEYGMQDKVPEILLNQNTVDFRDTIGEIVKDYPFSKKQQYENEKSQMNLYKVAASDHLNRTADFRFGRLNKDSKAQLSQKQKEYRLRTADHKFAEMSELGGQKSGRGMSSETPSVPFNPVHQPPSRFNNKAYMNSRIDNVISKQMGQTLHSFKSPSHFGGRNGLKLPIPLGAWHAHTPNRSSLMTQGHHHQNTRGSDSLAAEYSSVGSAANYKNTTLPSLLNNFTIHQQSPYEAGKPSHQANNSFSSDQPRKNSRLAMIDNILNPQYKKYRVAHTKMNAAIHGRGASQPTSLKWCTHSKPQEIEKARRKKEQELKEQEAQLDDIENQVMDTYSGLQHILGRLVANRAALAQNKKQGKINNILNKLGDNFMQVKANKLAEVQLEQNRNIMLNQMKLKMEERMMNKRLSLQLGLQEMQKFEELKLQARHSELDQKSQLGLSPRRQTTRGPDYFKKMTNAQLLASNERGSIDEIRARSLRRKTMVQYLSQAFQEIMEQQKQRIRQEKKEVALRKKEDQLGQHSIHEDHHEYDEDTFGDLHNNAEMAERERNEGIKKQQREHEQKLIQDKLGEMKGQSNEMFDSIQSQMKKETANDDDEAAEEGKEDGYNHASDCEEHMDELAASDFRWSFVPRQAYSELEQYDASQKGEEIPDRDQAALSDKIKEILGQQCQHTNVRYMDDNDNMVLNFHYRKSKELQAQKFQHLSQRDKDGKRLSALVPLDETTARLTEQISKFQHVQVSSSEVVDVLTQTLKVDNGDGTFRMYDFHQCQAALNQHYKNLKDEDGFVNPLRFDFGRWGWLGNQYLQRNNYQLPSWNQLKRAIINEQIVVLKDDAQTSVRKRLEFAIQKKFSAPSDQPDAQPLEESKKQKEEAEKTLEAMAIKGQTWEARFQYMNLPDDQDRPLEDNDFKNPYSRTNRAVFKLYSLETFLYWKLNKCAREQLEAGIENMGCFACVISKALDIANRYRQDQIHSMFTKKFIVYRGLSLLPNDIKAYKECRDGLTDAKQTINLAGYNSTSQERDVAIGFALKNRDPRRTSVLLEIDLKEGTKSGFCFVMNQECFTRFPEENEILLDDGIPFKVSSVSENEDFKRSGKTLVIIRLESKLAQQQVRPVEEDQDDIRGTLKTKQNLISFFNNGSRPPTKGYTSLYISSFMTETKDLVYGKKLPAHIPTVISSERCGYLAAVSLRPIDSDPLQFEQVTEWNDRDVLTGRKRQEFLGNNSFRIYNVRYVTDIQKNNRKYHDGKIRRYLTVQPHLASYRNETLSMHNDTPFVCFYPEKRYGSVWQFEHLKTDSNFAHYVILHKQWNWMREEGYNDNEYENCSWLAVKEPGQMDNELDKNEVHTYMYLTKDRSRAAVFTWKQWNLRDDAILMKETPLRWINHMLSKQVWILLGPGEHLDPESIRMNTRYRFDAEENQLFEVQFDQDKEDKEGVCVGTWTVHIDHSYVQQCKQQKGQKNLVNVDLADAQIEPMRDAVLISLRLFNDDDDEYEEVSLKLKFDEQNVLKCFDSDSKRFPTRCSLKSEIDPNIKMIRSLDKCKVFTNDHYKMQFVKFLQQQNIRLVNLIFKIHAKRWIKKKKKTDEEHFEEFHDKCDHKKTVVLILGENGRVFGGYNDIGWLGKDKVSTNKVHEKKSFLFTTTKNFIEEDEVDLEDTDLFHHKRCKGEAEIYHSENAGPNFIDLLIDGPSENSRIRNFKNYGLKPGDIVEGDGDQNGYQDFKYVMYEVYEAELIPPEEEML